MRIVLLTLTSAMLLAACGEKPPPSAAAAATPPAATPAPDAAPVNVPPADVAAKIAGKWVSINDPKSTLTVGADGSWIDDYAMDPPAHDVYTWRAFPGTEHPADAKDETFTPASTYIELKGAAGPAYYELGDVAPDQFEMFYVARGNRVAYNRVK